MPDSRVRVAVVGLGWMGTDHARVLADHPYVQLVAVVDRDRGRAERLGDQLGVGHAVELGDVLATVDAISVCTPDAVHADLTIRALRAGVAVLVEKPLATSVTEARRMLEAAPSPEALTVGHLLDVDPRVERARQIMRAGGIGELWHVRIRRHASRAIGSHVGSAGSVGWFGTIHDADLLLELVGSEPTSVRASGVRGRVSESWDVVDATVTFGSGVYATLHESWTLAAGRANRSDSGLALIGSDGVLEVELGHGQLLHSTAVSSVAPDVMHYPSMTLHDSSDLQVQLDRWVCTLRGGPAGVTGARAFSAVRLVAAIHEALDLGETIDLTRWEESLDVHRG